MTNYPNYQKDYNKKRLTVRRLMRLNKHKQIMHRFTKIKDLKLLGYTAGIIDGEGCILINRTGVAYTLQVRVGMATTAAVSLLHKMYGGTLQLNKRKDHTPMHIWVISSREAEGFLRLMLPYLIVKKEEAKVAIVFRENIMNTRNSNHKIPIEALATREACRIKLQELKRCSN